MIASLLVAAVESRFVLFTLSAPEAKSVFVAGTFNGWNKAANAMQRGADGTWTLRLSVPTGLHQYKFVVDGGTWLPDPKVSRKSEDGNGGFNSVLLVVPAAYDKPAVRGDGNVTTAVLAHDPAELGRFYDRGRLTLRLRTRANDVSSVTLHLKRDADAACIDQKMTRVGGDELFDRYTATVPWSGKGNLRYQFNLLDGKKLVHYGGAGASPSADTWFRVSGSSFHPFIVPEWVADRVAYQIFPDRFANGDKGNDPADVMPWDGKPTYSNRFGGDAAGIKSKANYLKALGIGIAYFTPVFSSPSNHRYDTTDYRKIDPQIGTNAEFGQATQALSQAGISSVLDIAFNHTATNNPWFMSLRNEGAKSPYVKRYFPKSFPIQVKENPNYEAWFGFPSMPKLNVMDPATTADLLSMPAFWEKQFPGVHGFRLDVANEVDSRFWQKFRTRVKSIDPSAWIIGEEWGDATKWLQGDQWDAQMNYPFRGAALDFFAKQNLGAKELWSRLETVRTSVPPQVARVQMNLLGTHDTPRWATEVGNRARADLGAVLLLTWVGVPTIYYGDELGMEGGVDPANRGGMRWDLVNSTNPTLKLYKNLIAARRESVALRQGDPKLLAIDASNNALAFVRTFKRDRAVVAFNRQKSATSLNVNLEGTWRDALTGEVYHHPISLPLRSEQAIVLLPVKASSLSAVSHKRPVTHRNRY